ncbi:prolipoprotein diacylglyceryl transferase [Paenibacillus filicis]|uniref:Prolipoprotein diacylglyceryl transferase n=1 Tax=Paenibacillus filicis TaxID=669464 RepID=A0ABU9DDZ4_9BACL
MGGAIVSARIWHVFFFQWEYYSKHLMEVFYIWQGGIAIQGALIGGFIALNFYTKKHRLSFWELADMIAPAIVLGQSLGRIACLLNGDAYGSPTGLGFGLVYPEGSMAYDAYGSQPLWPAGVLFLTYNIMYSFGRFNLEWLRGDSPRYTFHWTAGQWTSFGVILLSLCMMVFLVMRERKQVQISLNS